jgi:protease IV
MIEKYLNTPFALEPRFHSVQSALIMRRLARGEKALDLAEQMKERQAPYETGPMGGFYDENGSYHRFEKAMAKGGQTVAVIPIMGVMTRYGDMCSYGSEDIASWIMEANAMESVAGIVLEINSPGGQVDGTELLGEVVRQSQKPVVGFVAGMAASAAYWVASQCREIVMESETSSEVGSLGVLCMHMDVSGMLEKEGVRFTIIRADGSEDKARFNDYEGLSDELLAEVKASMNPIRASFIKKVKAGRPGIADDVFSGKMFNGKDALKRGMADRIGFLGDAVNRAALLASRAA